MALTGVLVASPAGAGRIGDCWTDYDGTNHCGDSGDSGYDWNFSSGGGSSSGGSTYIPPPPVDPRVEQARSYNQQGIAAFDRRKQDPGALDEAERLFRQAMEYEDHPQYRKNLADVLNSKGVLRHTARDYDGAIAFYEEALRWHPDNATVQKNLNDARATKANIAGNSAWDRGDLEAALRHYEEAQRLAPDDQVIRDNLSNTRAAMERSRREGRVALQGEKIKSMIAGVARAWDNEGTLGGANVSAGLDFLGDGGAMAAAPAPPPGGGLDFLGDGGAKPSAAAPPPAGGLDFMSDASVVDLRDIPEEKQVSHPARVKGDSAPAAADKLDLPSDEDIALLFDAAFSQPDPPGMGNVEDVLAAWAADPDRQEITGEVPPGLKQFPPDRVAEAFARSGEYDKAEAMLYALHYANVLDEAYGGMAAADKWNASLSFLETLARKSPAGRAALDELTAIRLQSGE